MRKLLGIALLIAALLALAACGGTSPVRSHATATTAAAAVSASPVPPPSSPPMPDTGTTDGSPFTCSTVVDSADSTSPFKIVADGGSLTAQQAIAFLEALLIADDVDLSAGVVAPTTAAVLDGAAQDLENYHLSVLAVDAQQFADDETSYSPDGPVDTSAWPAVQADILQLGKDCPGALAEAQRINRGEEP